MASHTQMYKYEIVWKYNLLFLNVFIQFVYNDSGLLSSQRWFQFESKRILDLHRQKTNNQWI